eukprot:g35960.t1
MFRPLGCRFPKVEYEVLLLQFAGPVTVTLEEAQYGHVTQGVGGGVKMVGNRKVWSFVTYRAQMLYETVSKFTFGLTVVEEATSGTVDNPHWTGHPETQGLVLGPLLFVIYINHLDENVQGMINKFADDTKIGSIVDSEEGLLTSDVPQGSVQCPLLFIIYIHDLDVNIGEMV